MTRLFSVSVKMFVDGHRTAHYGYANFRRDIAETGENREGKQRTGGAEARPLPKYAKNGITTTAREIK